MSNKAKLLAVLDEYRMKEYSFAMLNDFYKAVADAVDKLPDDIGDADTEQLRSQIKETINNVHNTFANGVIVHKTCGELTEIVTYVGELGIKQYNADKAAELSIEFGISGNLQDQFDDLVLTGNLKANDNESGA